jgi:hypothetical protein
MGAEVVYLTRTAVGIGCDSPLVTIQTSKLWEHGPGEAVKQVAIQKAKLQRKTIRIPVTIVPYDQLVERLGHGYVMELVFVEEREARLSIGDRLVKTATVGFLLRRFGAARSG